MVAPLLHRALVAAPPASAPGPIPQQEMVGLLRHLAESAGDPPDGMRAGWLHALCRKIAIAKRVWTAYDADWRKDPDAAPLPDAALALGVAVLLAYGRAATDAEPARRGPALKWVNGAFQALDLLATQPDVPLLAELRAEADAVLGEIAAG